MMTATECPRIYVACLSAYNAGNLHGAWIDCDGTEDIGARITEMLAASPDPMAEEWEIHDYENWQGLDPRRVGDIDNLAEWGEALEDCEYLGEFLSHVGTEYFSDPGEAIEEYREAIYGVYDDRADFAADHAETMGLDAPDWLQGYIDWDGLGRQHLMDWAFSADIANGRIVVFLRSGS